MKSLDKAIAIATQAHAEQKDKSGMPYILHPLRVMLKFKNEDEMAIAVMHDVVEDSDVTVEELRIKGFSNLVIDAIDCLTKRPGENYEHFIHRIMGNELATKVKIEDIKDNLNITRLKSLNNKDVARIEKYHRALNLLLEKS
ncbi:HD domain-containing protein [Thalassotalea euphylliae]|uniref:HD domain-containing protein n=1 Tax=Thalassotalea euphylliae TaxID=1655234 RepID=A0A3E0TRL5_9GAMM|nr:HD domain-containing protein [Thalassotalea euphylliae]REL26622.1 HD domain-containing protein [Thalassotalea euphylliae]